MGENGVNISKAERYDILIYGLIYPSILGTAIFSAIQYEAFNGSRMEFWQFGIFIISTLFFTAQFVQSRWMPLLVMAEFKKKIAQVFVDLIEIITLLQILVAIGLMPAIIPYALPLTAKDIVWTSLIICILAILLARRYSERPSTTAKTRTCLSFIGILCCVAGLFSAQDGLIQRLTIIGIIGILLIYIAVIAFETPQPDARPARA